MNLIQNRYHQYTPTAITSDGVGISCPVYINLTNDQSKALLNEFRNVVARQRIEMGFNPKSEIQWDCGLDEKPTVLPHSHEYRLTEFFLLMEQKGYIELLEIVSAERYLFPYNYVVNILRDPNEILSLEENWHAYGTLCLQPKSGHVFNGNVKPRLTPNSAPFKLLEALIKEPEKEFSIEELESFIFSADEKSVSPKQSKTRIQDAAKRARDALKMNDVASSVNIFSKSGSYWLGPVPSRK